MIGKPNQKTDDPAQYQRFRELAAELGAEDDEKALEKGVKRLGKAPRPPKAPKVRKKATRSQ